MRYEYKTFADYFQFYIEDEYIDVSDTIGDIWDDKALKDMIAVLSGFVAVSTVRNMDVPVLIDVLTKIQADTVHPHRLETVDHVVECSMKIASGKIIVRSSTDYYPDAPRIVVPPNTYRVRIYYNDLDRLSSDGLDGNDSYNVVISPDEYIEPIFLKRRNIT